MHQPGEQQDEDDPEDELGYRVQQHRAAHRAVVELALPSPAAVDPQQNPEDDRGERARQDQDDRLAHPVEEHLADARARVHDRRDPEVEGQHLLHVPHVLLRERDVETPLVPDRRELLRRVLRAALPGERLHRVARLPHPEQEEGQRQDEQQGEEQLSQLAQQVSLCPHPACPSFPSARRYARSSSDLFRRAIMTIPTTTMMAPRIPTISRVEEELDDEVAASVPLGRTVSAE